MRGLKMTTKTAVNKPGSPPLPVRPDDLKSMSKADLRGLKERWFREHQDYIQMCLEVCKGIGDAWYEPLGTGFKLDKQGIHMHLQDDGRFTMTYKGHTVIDTAHSVFVPGNWMLQVEKWHQELIEKHAKEEQEKPERERQQLIAELSCPE